MAQGQAAPFLGAARAMAEALSHRGPDSAGVECLGSCVLVNTRLAIVDLSGRARMPMSNDDQTVWITYNGEIYNAHELRQMLVKKGYRFRSASDTEVLLRLYEEFGEGAVQRLRGMFAFAIWDGRTRSLVLGRDRLGIKPLYFETSYNRIIFASELKGLLASGLSSRKLDSEAIRAFLQVGHIPPPWTVLESVKALEPGNYAVWQDGRLRVQEYWSLGPLAHASTETTREEMISRLSDVLLESARLHLASDVPIALFLSGGIDSACLAALLQEAGAKDLAAFTIGFDTQRYDESHRSRVTATALGIPHRVLQCSAKMLADHLDRAIWAMDQPTVDGINSYLVSSVVAAEGYKVAMTGQGADELFGGYDSLQWFRRLSTLALLRRVLPAKALANLLRQSKLPYRYRKLSYLLEIEDRFLAGQLAAKLLYNEQDARQLVNPATLNGHREFTAQGYLEQWASKVQDGAFDAKVSHLDIVTHLQPRLLRDMDAMSMANSLEVRPPYLDHRLVELAFSMPAPIRRQRKRLLLEATRAFLPESLYEDLASRPKHTFTFPFAQWINSNLLPMIESAIGPAAVRSVGVLNPLAVQPIWGQYQRSPAAVGWSRVWSIFALQRWCEVMRLRA